MKNEVIIKDKKIGKKRAILLQCSMKILVKNIFIQYDKNNYK